MQVEVTPAFQVFFILLYFLFFSFFLIIKIHYYDRNLRKYRKRNDSLVLNTLQSLAGDIRRKKIAKKSQSHGNT